MFLRNDKIIVSLRVITRTLGECTLSEERKLWNILYVISERRSSIFYDADL